MRDGVGNISLIKIQIGLKSNFKIISLLGLTERDALALCSPMLGSRVLNVVCINLISQTQPTLGSSNVHSQHCIELCILILAELKRSPGIND